MKSAFFLLLILVNVFMADGQLKTLPKQAKDITKLIDQYSMARETRDTNLLKKILMTDVDQLVSTGEWRTGISTAVEGMQKSSTSNPGHRALTVDKIRLLSPVSAIVDCRYEIANTSGVIRKMWSSFIVVVKNNVWKIAAIRNMLPAAQ